MKRGWTIRRADGLLLDVGHRSPNLLLAAEGLGLAACPIGGFREDALSQAIGIDGRETVLATVAAGYP